MKWLGNFGMKIVRILVVASALTTVIVVLDALLVPDDAERPR